MKRTEKLTIRRSPTHTVVKLVVTVDNITVDYSLKSYESNLADSIKTARHGCERLLMIARHEDVKVSESSVGPKVVSGGPVIMRPSRQSIVTATGLPWL